MARLFKDKRGDAAIYVCKDEYYNARKLISGNGYVGVALGQLAIFSFYYSPTVAHVLVELDLAALEKHIRKWKGPLILAGDCKAKVRAWTGGLRGPRGEETYLKK